MAWPYASYILTCVVPLSPMQAASAVVFDVVCHSVSFRCTCVILHSVAFKSGSLAEEVDSRGIYSVKALPWQG